MSNEPKVELASSSNKKIQWFHKILYSLDGRKQKLVGKKLKWFLAACLLGPFSYLLFQNPEAPKPKPQPQSTQETYQGQVLNIPDIGTKQAPGSSKNASKPKKYFSAQIILRPLEGIPPGSMIKAVLISGASNGPVKAELSEPIIINGEIMAETGSVLFGRGSSSEERLTIHFKQLFSKDGGVRAINAEACDGEDRIAGIIGAKVGKTALKLAGSIGLGLVGGLAEGLQQTYSQNGLEIKDPSLRNAALNGTAQAALDQSHEMMNSLREQKPIIEVKAGTSIFVIFEPISKEDTND